MWALVAHAKHADSVVRAQLAADWRRSAGSPRCVLLETCHRVELFGVDAEPPPIVTGAALLEGAEAVEHLLRVAAGVESTVVGEDEVLHQVRAALASARAQGPHDSRLTRLFETAIATGREARRGRPRANSLADLALEWLAARVDLGRQRLLVVGAGVVGARLAQAASRRGGSLTLASRDRGRAAWLARQHRGAALDLDEAGLAASSFAAVAVALSGPWTSLASERLAAVADLSSPSVVPRSLATDYLGIDDLLSPAAGSAPVGFVANAERIVAEKRADYMQWLGRRAA